MHPDAFPSSIVDYTYPFYKAGYNYGSMQDNCQLVLIVSVIIYLKLVGISFGDYGETWFALLCH